MMQGRASRVALATGVILFCTPALAFAEVMDKEPAPSEFWIWAVYAGALGLLAWAFLPRVVASVGGGITLVVGGVYLLGTLSEILDPIVGPAIAAEAGAGYAQQFWGALVAFVVLQTVGILVWWRRSPNKRVNLTRSK